MAVFVVYFDLTVTFLDCCSYVFHITSFYYYVGAFMCLHPDAKALRQGKCTSNDTALLQRGINVAHSADNRAGRNMLGLVIYMCLISNLMKCYKVFFVVKYDVI